MMRTRMLACGGLALLVLGAMPARAATVTVGYRITLAGLTLGTADLGGTFEGDRYTLSMSAQLTGIAGLLSGSGRGAASATGAVVGSRLVPTGFSATGRSSSAERTVRVAISSGNANRIEIDPPFQETPDMPPRVPLREADKLGIIDPLSAVVAVAALRAKPDEAANCNRTVPVFDGTQRFDIVMSFAETKRVQKPGFSGDVLVCDVRYVPVAGHRPERPSVKFMTDNREMNVWLAPVEGSRVLVPIRISVRTMLGTTVVEAERWTLDRRDGKPDGEARQPTR